MSTDKEKTEWDRIRESLGSEMESDLILKTTMSLLSLNYEKLSSSLKCCFMYLGMFPSNISIKCSRLIRLWIANEFVTGTGKSCRTLEEVGEDYMNELVHRNLVEAAGHYDDGRIKSCRVHNRVHEFILSKYLDENFGVIVNDHQDITTLSALIRRLSIQRSFENYPRKSDLSHLRCLHIYGSSLEDIKYDFRHLLVLDLEGTPLKKLPSEIGDLVYLKYLGLRKTKISALPKSATKLTKLETLNLKGTLISKLPDFISELQKLRHLLLPYNSEEKQGIELAQQVVAKLDQLQEISNVQVSQDSATYLQTLTKLKSISVVVRRQEDGKKLSSGSQKDDKQVSSTKQNDGGESSATVEMTATENAATSKGFACVQVLCLKGDLEGNLPSWIGMITATLVRLCLRDSGLEADPFELLLKGLDSLEVLTLNQAFKGEKLVLRSDLLGKLKVMKLINLEHLTLLELEDGAVPALEKLKIVGCTKLKAIPPAILYHKQLKELHFYEMQNPDLLMGIKPKVPLISWYPEWTVVDLQ